MISNQFSITIGIPTFNRAVQLNLLLKDFFDLAINVDVKHYGINLLISDNASTDNTQDIVSGWKEKLLNSGYSFCYVRQISNLGMDGNIKFIYENCKSSYLWFFSDDDILIKKSIIPLLEDLKIFKPDICLSNFIQFPYSEKKTIFLRDSKQKTAVLKDTKNCFDAIIKFPKLTNYILKPVPLTDYETLINSCVGDYYIFVVFALLVYSRGGIVLLRSGSIAKSASDYLSIEYSPRVFIGLPRSANKVLKYLGGGEYLNLIQRESRSVEMRYVLFFLTRHYSGILTLPDSIVMDEKKFIKENFLIILYNIRITYLFSKYMFWLLYSKLTFHKTSIA